MSIASSPATRRPSFRTLALVGSALGSTIVVPGIARAETVFYDGMTGYELTRADTISGGPRTVDITTTGGAIVLNLAGVEVANPAAADGVGIAAANAGTGAIRITSGSVVASGAGGTIGIDARAASGDIAITSGTVNSALNDTSYGIFAATAGGTIAIDANVTTGGQGGIVTTFVGADAPGIARIKSVDVTATGATNPYAILGQGETVSIDSGRAAITNVAGSSGATILANAGTGGATIVSTEAIAAGSDQTGISVFSNGAASITSGTVRITRQGDGILVNTAASIDLRSGTITTVGASSRGIAIAEANAPTSIVSGTIDTAGDFSHAIYLAPLAARSTIDSDTIRTAGAAAQGIFVIAPAGGTITGATIIKSKSITTLGADAAGIVVQGGTGAIDIASDVIDSAGAGILVDGGGVAKVQATRVTTHGANATAIGIGAVAGQGVVIDAGTIATAGDGSGGIVVSGDAASIQVSATDTATAGSNAAGIDARGSGAVAITAGSVTLAGAGATGITAISATDSASATATRVTALDRAIFVRGATGATVRSGDASTSAVNASAIIADSTGNGATGVTATGTTATIGAGSTAILATALGGAVTVDAATTTASGTGGAGIHAEAVDGDVAIRATSTTTSGAYDAVTGAGVDAVLGVTSGTGKVTIASGTASASGDYASAVFGSAGGSVTITSGTAAATGIATDTVGASSRTGDVAIAATTTTAAGVGGEAIGASARAGNVTIQAGSVTAAAGRGIGVTAGKIASVTATSVVAAGDGHAGVGVTGGTGVVLDIAAASSDGTATTTRTQTTTRIDRADAILATATTGAITARIGIATATGQGSDAVHLVANGAGGAVSATITGAVRADSGTGLFIDPPGETSIDVAAGASITGGAAGVNVTGGSNRIVNRGAIAGTAGAGIVANGATDIDNAGSISGANGVAVQLGGSDDSVTLRTGSSIAGRIVGGGGTDAAILVGGTAPQTIAGFDGFASLTAQSGYWSATTTLPSTYDSIGIAAGATIEIANGAGGAAITAASIVNNGALIVRSTADATGATFGGTAFTGSGTTRFTGQGTATLTGNDTLASTGTISIDGGSTLAMSGTQGGTIVTAADGTLRIVDGTGTGRFTGSLVDNGLLVVDRATAYAFDGALTGRGTLVKQGAGQLAFGSGYAFTGTTSILGGSIRLTAPVAAGTVLTLEGTGELDLSGSRQVVAGLVGATAATSVNIDGGALIVDQSSDTVFAGSIVGGGSLTKAGTGALTLTGRSTYGGATSVDGGRLAVNGAIRSAVTVGAGATLGGTGSVGGVTVASGGIYAPGNSIGTQTVAGNIVFAAGSIYAVEVDASGAGDRVDATGTATLSGGTVRVLTAPGAYARTTDYTILTAAGGVTGTFATVTSDYAFLAPQLAYSANAVTLSLLRRDGAFAAMAINANQRAVATAIEARGSGDPIFDAILYQTNATASASFQQLTGELHASLGTELLDSGHRFRDAVLDHGDAAGIWASGDRTNALSRTQPGLARLRAERTSIYGGVDVAVADVIVGVNGGYQDDDVTVLGQGSATVSTKLAGARAAWHGGGVTVQVGGSYAWHDIDTRRSVSVAGLEGTPRATGKARTAQLFAEAGYTLTVGAVGVTPFVRNALVHTDTHAYAESGGAAALRLARDRRDVDLAAVGLRLGGTQAVNHAVSIAPKMSIAYQRGFGDLAGKKTAQFVGVGPAFSIEGVAAAKNALLLDGSVDVQVGDRFRIGAGGFASTSDRWADYGAKVTASIRF